MSNTVEKEYLIKKSIDSFLMAIEVYNKPTIDYRLEGSLFFLHNTRDHPCYGKSLWL